MRDTGVGTAAEGASLYEVVISVGSSMIGRGISLASTACLKLFAQTVQRAYLTA